MTVDMILPLNCVNFFNLTTESNLLLLIYNFTTHRNLEKFFLICTAIVA